MSHQPLAIPPRVQAGDFSGWLREAMMRRGVSLRMVATQAGVDHTTIQRLATGDRLPSLATAVALIRVLERPSLSFTSVNADHAIDARLPGAS